MSEKSIFQKSFSNDDLWAIKTKIAEAELKTSGEIRVKIRDKCEEKFEGGTRAQAEADFYAEGLNETRDKTGVLILLVLGQKKLEILADQGINSMLLPNELNSITAETVSFFREGRFKEGVVYAIDVLAGHLATYFPRKDDDKNELPDDVIVEVKR